MTNSNRTQFDRKKITESEVENRAWLEEKFRQARVPVVFVDKKGVAKLMSEAELAHA